MASKSEHHFIEYYFKDISANVFEIAKFKGNKRPEIIYTLIWNERYRSWKCDCPGFWRTRPPNCKHVDMIQEWLKAGKPSPFEKFFISKPVFGRKPSVRTRPNTTNQNQ